MEQLSLFDLGVDMGNLRALRGELSASAKLSANTRRACAGDFRHFEDWCVAAPAGCRCRRRLKLWRCTSRRWSLRRKRSPALAGTWSRSRTRTGKPSPIGDEAREVLAGARRKFGSASAAAKAALTPVELRKMCRKLLSEGTSVGVRDRALMVLGFATGLRRSELAALDLAGVELLPRHRLIVRVGRSKTDQAGNGRRIGVFAGRRVASGRGLSSSGSVAMALSPRRSV